MAFIPAFFKLLLILFQVSEDSWIAFNRNAYSSENEISLLIVDSMAFDIFTNYKRFDYLFALWIFSDQPVPGTLVYYKCLIEACLNPIEYLVTDILTERYASRFHLLYNRLCACSVE